MNAGLDGSNAGTALRASLLALNQPATAQRKMMESLGISMRDGEDNALGLSEMIQELTEATAHMSEADKVATLGKLVGTEAVSGFLSLIKAGPAEIEKMTSSLENSAGASKAAADQMMAGIGGAFEQLSGAFQSAVLIMGDQFAPTIQGIAVHLTGLIEKFNGLSEGTQAFLAKAALFTVAITAIGTGIGLLIAFAGTVITSIGAISAAMAALATTLGIAGGAMGLLSAAFGVITGPIGITVAAIAGLIAVLVVVYNKVWWFNELVNDAWNVIKEGTVKAFKAIKEAITNAIKAFLDFAKPQLDKFKALWDENGKAIMILVKTYFNNVKTVIEGVMGVIKGIFQVVWPIISAVVKNAWETIKLAVSTAINIVLGVVQTVLKLLQGDWKGAWTTILNTVKSIWGDVGKFLKGIDLAGTGRDIINGLIKGISSMGKSVINAAKGLANNIKDAFTGLFDIHSPSRWMEDMIGGNMMLGWIKGIKGMRGAVVSTAKDAANWMTPSPTLAYDAPTTNGASGGALRKLETEMQATLKADEASRGDIVLNVDGYEMARVQQPHLDRMQGSNNSLRLFTRGR